MEKKSLGVTLNNPCNIRYNGIQWKGLSYPLRVKGFCKFANSVYGIRAFLVILRTYITKHNIKTVRQFVNRYAPSGDGANDPTRYAAFLLQSWKNWNKFLVSQDDKVFDDNFFSSPTVDRLELLFTFTRAVCAIESGFVLEFSDFELAFMIL